MREISFNNLEIEIVGVIREWYDNLIREYGDDSLVKDIDAGDAADLASEIVTQIIMPGIQIIGEFSARRKLSEGWE